ncbi:capsular polysaccharide biosynthesis protein [Maritimibacter sp. DP1N21-5]|nr:capsular polysaccharide biosynthesis protein [Maritimibacter sp. DP1N21-5]
MLTLAGWELSLGLPGPDDHVAVWGASPTSQRGLAIAEKRGARLLRIEDAFLRSVRTGRDGEAPLGLLLDRSGVHFDPKVPSDLERMLASAPLDDHALLSAARDGIDRIRAAHVSKYNAFDPRADLPKAPYVLVIDQTRGDAAVLASGATPALFTEMLIMAQEENPGLPVIIKTHPETEAGHRPGYYGPEHAVGKVRLCTNALSPWALMEGAVAVYTVSSGMGFEAIMAGHKPRVFGQPFYAGWGLTKDENPVPRRERKLTRAQLFAAAMIEYPIWYDPYRDRLCDLDTVISTLEARARAAREDAQGYVASNMRLWKRRPVSQFFATDRGVVFAEGENAARRAEAEGRRHLTWGVAQHLATPVVQVEDGFIRSRGLGAELVPPLSLALDDIGIYYDPTRPSRLEALIEQSVRLPDGCRYRAERLVARLIRAGITKYNLDRAEVALPHGPILLAPGQVEDDASIRLGTAGISRNIDLLKAARTANPTATIVYKPHPDVEAGLREGRIAPEATSGLADLVARQADMAQLLDRADAVWTMTSLAGFEALLRGKSVTCLGAPFYAGWGLTRDLGKVPDRRKARPDLLSLAHAVLIDYPRYFDPVTGTPCPPEVVLDRIEAGETGSGKPGLRVLSKLQGLMASRGPLWRR